VLAEQRRKMKENTEVEDELNDMAKV
jgi:hypothetical protein